jgi:hypothetical protein
VAIHLQQGEGRATLAALVSRPTGGRLQILAGSSPILDEAFSADPAVLTQWDFNADGPVRIQFTDNGGQTLLTYQAN